MYQKYYNTHNISLASQTLMQERGSGELPIVEFCTQNRVVKECNYEAFVFITEWPYVTHSRDLCNTQLLSQ